MLVGESGRSASISMAAASVAAGILLFAKPQLVLRGLSLFVGGSFLLGGLATVFSVCIVRKIEAGPGPGGACRRLIRNLLLGLMLITRWPLSGVAFVEISCRCSRFSQQTGRDS